MASAQFVTSYSVQIDASDYFGIDASSAQAIYTAGACKFVAYEPSTSALTTAGYSSDKVPLVVQLPGSGFGTHTTLNSTEGNQMFQQAGPKLGWAADRLGSDAVPVQNWPTYFAFPQFAIPNGSHWSGSASDSGARDNRAAYAMITAVVLKMLATYPNIDPTRIYVIGHSGGAGFLLDYVSANYKWPSRFPIRFAAGVSMAGAISGSGMRQNLPEMLQGENSTNQTIPKVCRWLAELGMPIWFFDSAQDGQVSQATFDSTHNPMQIYTPLGYTTNIAAGTSAGTFKFGLRRLNGSHVRRGVGFWYRHTEYTGGSSPTHSNTPDIVLSNNNAGGGMSYTDPLWQMVLGQSLKPIVRHAPTSPVWSYAGGSGSPATLTAAGPGDSGTMMRMMRKRRRLR